MAIFYQMIKGLNTTDSGSSLLYCYLTWPDKSNKKPNLYIGSNTNLHTVADIATQAINLGELLTSNSNNVLTKKLELKWVDKDSYGGIYTDESENGIYCTEDKKLHFKGNLNLNVGATIEGGKLTPNNFSIKASEFTLTDSNNVFKYENSQFTISKKIHVDDCVEATYFNATSDERAKQDIKLLDINALDIIKQVQVKTFKFKFNPSVSMVGIIAQELQKAVPELNLVNNLDADGIKSFMSIKEDRLIYILWKAVQEQQSEIEKLKTQIEQLKR